MQKRSKRLCLALAVLLSVSMVLVALVPAVEAASYKKGSSGAVVTQIQTKLKSWGYYTGTVDGIYGSGTERAVRAFQQKNGLTVDGKAGDQPYSGQVAVGAVVLNRIKHPSFPNTLSGVIYQSGAFTCITDGQFNQPVAESAYRAARDALNGVDPSGGAIYYFNPSTATSSWIWSRPLITVIGKHRFCS